MAEFIITNKEHIRTFTKTVKLMKHSDDKISLVLREDRLLLFVEGQSSAEAIVATFKDNFFGSFNVAENKTIAISSEVFFTVVKTCGEPAVSLKFQLRSDENIDILIENNTGTTMSYGCPISDIVHDLLAEGNDCDVAIETNPTIRDNSSNWYTRCVKLFPGKYVYMGLFLDENGLSISTYNHEEPSSRIQFTKGHFDKFDWKKNLDITMIPQRILKRFLEYCQTNDLEVSFSPVKNATTSQLNWQAISRDKSSHLTLLLGCNITEGTVIVKKSLTAARKAKVRS